MNSEILIYIQTVKTFFNKDDKAKQYFLSNTNEEDFFKYLYIFSEKNIEERGEPALTIEQFEEVKKITQTASKQEYDKEDIKGHFFHSPIFGNISLN